MSVYYSNKHGKAVAGGRYLADCQQNLSDLILIRKCFRVLVCAKKLAVARAS